MQLNSQLNDSTNASYDYLKYKDDLLLEYGDLLQPEIPEVMSMIHKRCLEEIEKYKQSLRSLEHTQCLALAKLLKASEIYNRTIDLYDKNTGEVYYFRNLEHFLNETVPLWKDCDTTIQLLQEFFSAQAQEIKKMFSREENRVNAVWLKELYSFDKNFNLLHQLKFLEQAIDFFMKNSMSNNFFVVDQFLYSMDDKAIYYYHYIKRGGELCGNLENNSEQPL